MNAFPLHELAGLLATRQAMMGVVVDVTEHGAVVATADGAVTARYTVPLAVGDRVCVRSGVAEAVPPARMSIAV